MHVKVGDQILFRIPFFDSFLYYRGEVVNQNDKLLSVKYTTEIEILNGYEKITHITDIPFSFIVNEKMEPIHHS